MPLNGLQVIIDNSQQLKILMKNYNCLSSLLLKSITYTYPHSESAVITSFSAEIPAGQVTILKGPSASGKTTLGKLIKGILKPDSGSIGVCDPSGCFVSLDEKQRMNQIGWVTAHPETQIFSETVREEVSFGPANQGYEGDDLNTRVSLALDRMGLSIEKHGNLNPILLSGGEKRRIAIAGIIAMEYTFFIMDEPTAGLDYYGIVNLIDMTKQLAGVGNGICWITHDENLVKQINCRTIEVAIPINIFSYSHSS